MTRKAEQQAGLKARLAEFSKPARGGGLLPVQAAGERLAVLRQNLGKVVTLPLAGILVEDNVRQVVETESPDFRELVDSVRQSGLLQNLIVELREREGGWDLVCVAGQRRLLAARAAGLEKGPALLRQYRDAAERIAEGLAENLLREGLPPLDIADGYARLQAAGWNKEQIQDYFSRGRKTVERYLALSRYPAEVRSLMRRHPGVFTGHVLLNEFAARRWKSEEALLAAAREKVAKADKSAPRKPRGMAAKSDFEKRTAEDLRRSTGAKVIIRGTEEQGRVTLDWKSRKEFRALIQRLRGGRAQKVRGSEE